MRTWMMLMVLATGIPANVGCDSAEAAFDCQQVCSRYQSCFDGDYGVSECRNRCRDKANDDDTWKAKADACASCIDDKSCAAATFTCVSECAGIVP